MQPGQYIIVNNKRELDRVVRLCEYMTTEALYKERIRNTQYPKELYVRKDFDELRCCVDEHEFCIRRSNHGYTEYILPTNSLKGLPTMLKAKAQELRESLKPYERYIVIAALLIALDHFILKGAMRGKITDLGTALGNKFVIIINKAIEKLEA